MTKRQTQQELAKKLGNDCISLNKQLTIMGSVISKYQDFIKDEDLDKHLATFIRTILTIVKPKNNSNLSYNDMIESAVQLSVSSNKIDNLNTIKYKLVEVIFCLWQEYNDKVSCPLSILDLTKPFVQYLLLDIPVLNKIIANNKISSEQLVYLKSFNAFELVYE